MSKEVSTPFTEIFSTQRGQKDFFVSRGIALSPVVEVVAESERIEEQDIIRFTNYASKEVIGHVLTPAATHTLRFSGNGERLLAITGMKNFGRSLLVFSQPWASSHTVESILSCTLVLDSCWLNNDEILIVGATEHNRPYIEILNVQTGSQLIHIHDEVLEAQIDSAACSPSGLVVFSTGFGEYLTLVQINHDRSISEDTFIFPTHNKTGNRIISAVSEDGQTIVHASSRALCFFNRNGDKIKTIERADCQSLSYRDGNICFSISEGSRRSRSETVRVFRVDQGFREWGSTQSRNGVKGIDIVTKGERTLVVIADEEATTVYSLLDPHVLQLQSEEPEERREAAIALGKRKFHPSIPDLLSQIWKDEDLNVQKASIGALVAIADPTVLNQFVRMLGHRVGVNIKQELLSAIVKFPTHELSPVIFRCLDSPSIASRRGAVSVLEKKLSIEALDALCTAVSDSDKGVRLTALRALEKRKDLRACASILGCLADEDREVTAAVHQAMCHILIHHKLLKEEYRHSADEKIDIAAYVKEVISTGKIKEFKDCDTPRVGNFLTGMALACIHSDQSLPEILNAIEALTEKSPDSPLSLTIALILADAMNQQDRWGESITIYQSATTIAQRLDIPQIEWKSWHSIGVCFEKLANDTQAIEAFRKAISVIDRLWFALLEEDKLRDFFQDKSELYDRTELCYLRLGHYALALECRGKAKTRYLGDLIARRQVNPKKVAARELIDFWKNVGKASPTRVNINLSQYSATEPREIISVEQGSIDTGLLTVVPEQFSRFEDAYQNNIEYQQQWTRDFIVELWRAIGSIDDRDDDFWHELLEDIYQCLSPFYQAARTGELPIADIDRGEYLKDLSAAVQKISDRRRSDRDTSFWVFPEYLRSLRRFLEKLSSEINASEEVLLLYAIMEALNVFLHHEPVIGIPCKPSLNDLRGLIFTTRALSNDLNSLNNATKMIESNLKRYSQSRWKYMLKLARGQTATFSDIADSLSKHSDIVHLEFSVTESGTVIYVVHGVEERNKDKDQSLLPDLNGSRELAVFSNPNLTTSSLSKILIEDDNSWFALYNGRKKAGKKKKWIDAMEQILASLYAELIKPIEAHLQKLAVSQLHIVPNRALHLVPFPALHYTNKAGERRYLIDDYKITYAPSATIQEICRERALNRSIKQELTAVSNPTMDLLCAAQEIKTISSSFPKPDQSILCGLEATLSNVTQSTPSAIHHFASHASYCWQVPLESALDLAKPEKITLAALFDEQISLSDTCLAVLSACETGISDPSDLVDEYIGLAAGFLFSGVPWCISSLWAVDDFASMLLMIKLYENLSESKNVATALISAQQWLKKLTIEGFENFYQEKLKEDFSLFRRGKQLIIAALVEKIRQRQPLPFSHPYYWAAFTVAGFPYSV